MSEHKSDIEVIGDVCEVSTEQYCTTFRTRDIGISAGNQIALLHSMLIDRDQRLAATEALLREACMVIERTGEISCDGRFVRVSLRTEWHEAAKGGRE